VVLALSNAARWPRHRSRYLDGRHSHYRGTYGELCWFSNRTTLTLSSIVDCAVRFPTWPCSLNSFHRAAAQPPSLHSLFANCYRRSDNAAGSLPTFSTDSLHLIMFALRHNLPCGARTAAVCALKQHLDQQLHRHRLVDDAYSVRIRTRDIACILDSPSTLTSPL